MVAQHGIVEPGNNGVICSCSHGLAALAPLGFSGHASRDHMPQRAVVRAAQRGSAGVFVSHVSRLLHSQRLCMSPAQRRRWEWLPAPYKACNEPSNPARSDLKPGCETCVSLEISNCDVPSNWLSGRCPTLVEINDACFHGALAASASAQCRCDSGRRFTRPDAAISSGAPANPSCAFITTPTPHCVIRAARQHPVPWLERPFERPSFGVL